LTPGDFLSRMADGSRQRVLSAQAECSALALQTRVDEKPPPPTLQLSRFDLIAEVKQRSPAAGTLTSGHFNISEQVTAYATGGAAAISVLTEPEQFHGSLDDLETAAAQLAPLGIPAMRKDFLVDAYQLLEARAAGAGGVLLIVAILNDAELTELLDAAERLGLFVLLEAFSAEDTERAAALLAHRGQSTPPILFGVNCRDLTTLEIDFRRFEPLSRNLPVGFRTVAESGLKDASDAAQVAQWGYELALVGSALMSAEDPAAAVRAMLAAGRQARELADVR
jgi:indole-3-glycerol phosphate synthase